MEEYEIKFLEVEVDTLEQTLRDIGATKVGEYAYSRALFDYPDFRMNKRDAWLRLRTNGIETTLAYKESIKNKGEEHLSDIGMKEIEVKVDAYDATHELLKAIGFIVKREEKNKRIRYEKNDVVYDIDFWPMIPPYLEIESSSYEKARQAANELGFDGSKGLISSAGAVYAHYGLDNNDYTLITFEKQVKK
jgi:adenylate cyclase, class 2